MPEVHVRPLLAVAVVLAACTQAPPATPIGENPGSPPSAQPPADRSPTPANTRGVVIAETVAGGLVNPWAIEFLPDGRALVTERPGRLRVLSATGQLSAPVTGVPAVFAQGQGGLLDVAVDPQFSQNQLVYLSFAESGEGGAGTAVVRARFTGTALVDVQVIFRQTPKLNGGDRKSVV